MSAPTSSKPVDLFLLALIVLAIVAGGLSDDGMTAFNDHDEASALAWPYRLFLSEGWGQVDSPGHVSVDLWAKVFICEAGAIVLVIAILVLGGMAAWFCLVKLLGRWGKGNRIR